MRKIQYKGALSALCDKKYGRSVISLFCVKNLSGKAVKKAFMPPSVLSDKEIAPFFGNFASSREIHVQPLGIGASFEKI